MEKVAQESVLENIKTNLRQANQNEYVRRIKEFAEDVDGPVTLGKFLTYYDIEPADLYKKGTWSRLCAKAGIREHFETSDEEILSKGLRRICHQNSAPQLQRINELLSHNLSNSELIERFNNEDKVLLTMLCFSVWNGKPPEASLAQNLHRLVSNDVLFAELRELISYIYDSTNTVVKEANLPFPCPLYIHARYTRDEILSGLGYWSIGDTPSMREGVKYLKDINADIFFITLNKTEKDYSPTTMYEDYAIDDTLFHWQSQSTIGSSSPTGKRYITHKQEGTRILLFVREHKKENGLAAPYYFLGPADYISHKGNRPMSIIWKLHNPMPAKLVRDTVRMGVA